MAIFSMLNDLGFLLISFFIKLSTTYSPNILSLIIKLIHYQIENISLNIKKSPNLGDYFNY